MTRKQLGLRLLGAAGAFRAGRWLNRHRVVVLTYHKILPDSMRGMYDVRPETVLFRSEFERHVEWLNRRYQVLDGVQFRSWLGGSAPVTRPSALITFDDGYANNFREAFPVLKRAGMGALFFLSTRFVEGSGSYLWFDRMDAIGRTIDPKVLREWAEANLPPDLRTFAMLRAWLKTAPAAERDALVSELECVSGPSSVRSLDATVAGPMTWAQAREMAAEGMTFGSHTVNHQVVSGADDTSVNDELVDSRLAIESNIGHACWSFSYPNGERGDFRPSDTAAVIRAGYECAFTQIPGFVDTQSDRFALPRMPIPASGAPDVFASRVTGVHSLLTIG